MGLIPLAVKWLICKSKQYISLQRCWLRLGYFQFAQQSQTNVQYFFSLVKIADHRSDHSNKMGVFLGFFAGVTITSPANGGKESNPPQMQHWTTFLAMPQWHYFFFCTLDIIVTQTPTPQPQYYRKMCSFNHVEIHWATLHSLREKCVSQQSHSVQVIFTRITRIFPPILSLRRSVVRDCHDHNANNTDQWNPRQPTIQPAPLPQPAKQPKQTAAKEAT